MPDFDTEGRFGLQFVKGKSFGPSERDTRLEEDSQFNFLSSLVWWALGPSQFAVTPQCHRSFLPLKSFLRVELVAPMRLGGNGKKEFCCKDSKTFWQTWTLEDLTVKMTRDFPRLAVREDVRPQDFLLKQLGGMNLLAGKRLKKNQEWEG